MKGFRMIVIATTFRGDVATASAQTEHGSFYEEARTGALAVSEICKKMARKKQLIGETYLAPEFDLKGVVGRKPRRERAEEASFDLVGGQMNFGRKNHA